ncbi:MAG TPA: PIN domain-containing protein [Thermofilaceae archaeon]|nr:PIN domain-containing protein [Thermofilaceae archaeon]
MERKEVVVDASIVVKWFVEEEYSREARLLRDAYANELIDVVAPSLLPYEVLNALKYSGAFGEEELKEIARTLEDFQITLFNLEGELASRSVELAMRKGITVYDASYIALAQILDTVLYTADEKLIRKARGLDAVRHIAQFKI